MRSRWAAERKALELSSNLARSSSYVIGFSAEPRLYSSTSSKLRPSLQHDLDRAFEAPWARIVRIDVILNTPRQREDLWIVPALHAICGFTERSVIQGFGQAVLQTDAPVRIGRRSELFCGGLAHDSHDERRHGAFDSFHFVRLNSVLFAQPQYRADIGMNYVRGRKWFKRRISTLPMLAELMVDTREIAMRCGVLHMRREKSPASFEYLGRARHSGASEQRRRDPALRRPTRMQKLGLRPVHPAFQQSRRRSFQRCLPRERALPRRDQVTCSRDTRRRTLRTIQWDESRVCAVLPRTRCRRGRRSRCRSRWP